MPSIKRGSLEQFQTLVKRQYYGYCDSYYDYNCGWSTGTRIGVGVAIAAGVIILILLISCLARRRRARALSSTRPMFGAPSAYYGNNQQQPPVNVLPQQQTGYQTQPQSYPNYDPTNVQYNQNTGGYYNQTGNAGYQYPPPASYGNQHYAPPEGPPPAEDAAYTPPVQPPPVYREDEASKKG